MTRDVMLGQKMSVQSRLARRKRAWIELVKKSLIKLSWVLVVFLLLAFFFKFFFLMN